MPTRKFQNLKNRIDPILWIVLKKVGGNILAAPITKLMLERQLQRIAARKQFPTAAAILPKKNDGKLFTI
jgi:hypothetical protein